MAPLCGWQRRNIGAAMWIVWAVWGCDKQPPTVEAPPPAPPAAVVAVAAPATATEVIEIPIASTPVDLAPAATAIELAAEATSGWPVVQNAISAWNAGELAAAATLLTQDCTEHLGSEATYRGRVELLELWTEMRTIVPDAAVHVRRAWVGHDRVALWLALTGHQAQPWRGMPNQGRAIAVEFLQIVEFRAGLIAQIWTARNQIALATQLGWLHGPTPALAQGAAFTEVVELPEDSTAFAAATAWMQNQPTAPLAQWGAALQAEIEYVDLAQDLVIKGIVANVAAISAWRHAFDERELTIADAFSVGPWVVIRSVQQAVHSGKLGNIRPLRQTIAYAAIDIVLVQDGKIARVIGASDPLQVLRGLGVQMPWEITSSTAQ